MPDNEWTALCRKQRAAYNAWQAAPAGQGWTEALDHYRAVSKEWGEMSTQMHVDRMRKIEIEAYQIDCAREIADLRQVPVWVVLREKKTWNGQTND